VIVKKDVNYRTQVRRSYIIQRKESERNDKTVEEHKNSMKELKEMNKQLKQQMDNTNASNIQGIDQDFDK
jgi:hypothetical protein